MRISDEEQKVNLKQTEALPRRGDMDGEEGDLRKANRSKRPKLTEEEIGELKNRDRSLTKNEWVEMSVEKQWVTLASMGFSKEEKPGGPTESKTVTINVAHEETERPKPPPPQAPWEFRTYPEAPTQEPGKLAYPALGSG